MRRWLAGLGVALLLAGPAGAQEMLPGLLQEPLAVAVVLADGRRVVLEGMVTRPDRAGRFPLAVLVHGTPRPGNEPAEAMRARMRPSLMSGPAIAFAQRGYAAVTVLRRGFGRSGGSYAEQTAGSCDNADPLPSSQASGQDVAAAVASLRGQSWVDPSRVLLVGISTGGVAVTAAAAGTPAGVVGVLDFAGGRGSAAPDRVCSPGRLVAALGRLGQTARVPALWVYAENDHFFGPELARRMFEAYVAGGAPARLQMMPPYGSDGPVLLTKAPEEVWWPAVAGFLEGLGLPTRVAIVLPPLPELPPSRFMSASCRAGLAAYSARRSVTKVFADSASGHCGWQTGSDTVEESQERALVNCSRYGGGCRIYAIGQSLVR